MSGAPLNLTCSQIKDNLVYNEIMGAQPQKPTDSKFFRVFVFILLLVILFCMAFFIAYQSNVRSQINSDTSQIQKSNSDAESKEEFCGGFAGIACPEGYVCKLEGKYPDAGGVCVKP
jgi:hypothetical protein